MRAEFQRRRDPENCEMDGLDDQQLAESRIYDYFETQQVGPVDTLSFVRESIFQRPTRVMKEMVRKSHSVESDSPTNQKNLLGFGNGPFSRQKQFA